MKKKIFVFFILAVFSFCLAGESLARLAVKAEDGGPLFETLEWKGGPAPEQTLLPDDAPGARELRERFLAFEPEITVEQFIAIPLPAGLSSGTPEEKRAIFTKIVNAFGNPETQETYTYWSSTRKKNMILFEKSYISDSRGKRQNPFSYLEGTLPGRVDYYQYIKEANFSGTVMAQSLIITEDYLNFRSTNHENMRYSFVRIMDKEEMKSELLVFPYENLLCVYYCTQIKTEPKVKQVMGITIRLPLMFEKRMDIMAKWLKDRLYE